MVDTPEKIWIEQDDCPYFYEESELTEVGSPVTEYTRSDLVAELEAENEWLKHALEAEKKRADEAEEQLVIVRRQRDDMNAAYQFECKAAREREAVAISAEECARRPYIGRS